MGTKTSVELVPTDGSMRDWAEQLVARSRAEGIELTGADGLLTALMRTVLQTGLEVEMAEHLGYEPHDQSGRGSGNSRNGSYPKTVSTEIGDIELRVPRDRNASFDPVTVPKHVRRLDGLNANVLSLYAKGLTTGEIQAHLLEIYGTELSRDTVSKITDAVVEEMTAWQNRPLERVYAVVLIDAIVVKVRDSQVANRPVYVAIGVTMDGQRDVLGLWLGPTGGEGAKQWMTMLTELRNRGLLDVLIVCCDGLKGLPEAIRTTWPDATVQTCVVHLVRNSLRYASKKHWTQTKGNAKTNNPIGETHSNSSRRSTPATSANSEYGHHHNNKRVIARTNTRKASGVSRQRCPWGLIFRPHRGQRLLCPSRDGCTPHPFRMGLSPRISSRPVTFWTERPLQRPRNADERRKDCKDQRCQPTIIRIGCAGQSCSGFHDLAVG